MRQIVTRALSGLAQTFDERHLSILMLGLDSAEKSAIICKLKLDENQTKKPTIGFNVETVQYRNVNFTMWDVGAQDKTRSLWRHYFLETQGLILVVNSNDPERVVEARDELRHLMVDPDLQDVALLVLANNSGGDDILPNGMNVAEMTEKLQLHNYDRNAWFVQSCCATSGEGLFEGLEWLAAATKRKNASPKPAARALVSDRLALVPTTKKFNANPKAKAGGAHILEERDLTNSRFGSQNRISSSKASTLQRFASRKIFHQGSLTKGLPQNDPFTTDLKIICKHVGI